MGEQYGADQIQILEGLEAVRKRPGMYIGSTSARGLHHLVYEIVDNAVDEALAGYCDSIDVTINPDNSITVIDDGRGIPVDIQKKAGLPAVEVVFTILHAGGKFGNGGYKVSGGLHGVGASVVNALSEWLEVLVYRDGNIYKQRYERGKVCYPLKVVGNCSPDKHGTTVTFLPDKEIFEETVFEVVQVPQDAAAVELRLRIAVGEVHAVGSGKLYGRQQADSLAQQLLFFFSEYAGFASFFNGIEQESVSQIFLQIVHFVFGTDEYFGYGQAFPPEMLCHIEKCSVFFDGFTADTYQRGCTCETEVAAVGAGRGEFVNGFGFVSGMYGVEFLQFFGYHSVFFIFGS